MRKRTGRQTAGPLLAALLVLLGHGLLWLLLNGKERPSPRSAVASRMVIIALQPIAPRPPAPAPAPAPAQAQTVRSHSGNRRSTAPRPAQPRTAPETASAEPISPLPDHTAATPSTSASAALPSLLDSEATRRAVRQTTREPLLSERAAAATQAPAVETAQQRLGREIGQSATGECLKGEYLGGGLGPLSLPFWLLAEARGKCRR